MWDKTVPMISLAMRAGSLEGRPLSTCPSLTVGVFTGRATSAFGRKLKRRRGSLTTRRRDWSAFKAFFAMGTWKNA